jgi:ATP-binding cassette subfamily C protein
MRLLTKRDRRLFALAVTLQMSTSFLDLAGVLLTGLVGAVAVTTVQSAPPPPAVQQVASTLGLGDLDSESLVIVLAVGAAVVLLGKSILAAIFTRRVLMFLANRQAIVSGRLTKELLSRPITFVQRRTTQETAYALIQGAAAATMQVLGLASIVLTEFSLLVVLSVALFFLDPLITLGSIAFFGLLAWALQKALGNWASRIGNSAAIADIESLGAIQEALSAYREVTVTHRRGQYVARIQSLRWDAAKVAADAQLMGLVPKYLFETALVLGAFVLAGTLFSTKDAAAAVGSLALFLAAASRVMPSLLRLQGSTLALRGAASSATATFDLADELDNPLEHDIGTADITELRKQLSSRHPEFSPSIEIKNVTYTYPNAPAPALSNVSISVAPGRSLALAGKSGAGKSTLADIILGVLDPESGEVKVGGLNPTHAIQRWPGGVAYVPQTVVLAKGTVRQNVALGVPDSAIDDEMAWEALERAHLAEYLLTERDGLDTVVGERGIKFSGGQRQRLGIARALYSHPRVLVLDEATSALDAETELAVTETIRDLENEVTTIVIAHRLSTVRHASTVAYLEAGRITAVGTFDEVRSASPAMDRQASLLGIDE